MVNTKRILNQLNSIKLETSWETALSSNIDLMSILAILIETHTILDNYRLRRKKMKWLVVLFTIIFILIGLTIHTYIHLFKTQF